MLIEELEGFKSPFFSAMIIKQVIYFNLSSIYIDIIFAMFLYFLLAHNFFPEKNSGVHVPWRGGASPPCVLPKTVTLLVS